ncbi:acyl-CoA dehydrogenase family protein [Halosolutus amylolyticus]|uniref:Acyl-CoA dehydrogenase family protein n=1 Tax=Halosolutus amylolyticus TaxID=2932267 RepID=A0ABD5PIY2_9EURY|nr:acyl-CoA dehydrogenase family protein [Halosolutus amylolyticus]
MRFELTEEQRQVRDAIQVFVEEEVEPVARELDRGHEYPAELLQQLADQGIMGTTLPQEYGGLGYGMVEYALIIEELSKGLMALGSAINVHVITASLIQKYGNDYLKETYLPEMATYDTVGAFGLTEPNAGSDNAAMECQAERDGDEWVINGQKRWITNSPNADVISVLAKTGPESDRYHNISAFLVPTDADGFEIGKEWDTLGLNSVQSCDLHLNGVCVPEEHLIGEENEGFMHVVQGLNVGRVNVAARCSGMARAAVEDATAYAKEREQFGQPIGDFQGIRWKIAEMEVKADIANLLTLRAADFADRGHGDKGREESIAKLYSSEAAVENAHEAIQILGGNGYTKEYNPERYLRDAQLLTIGEGTNEIHRKIIADRVLGPSST